MSALQKEYHTFLIGNFKAHAIGSLEWVQCYIWAVLYHNIIMIIFITIITIHNYRGNNSVKHIFCNLVTNFL